MELLDKDPTARPGADSALIRLEALTAVPAPPAPAEPPAGQKAPPVPVRPPPDEPPKRAFWVLLGLLAAVVLAFLAYHVTSELASFVTGGRHWLPRPISGIP